MTLAPVFRLLQKMQKEAALHRTQAVSLGNRSLRQSPGSEVPVENAQHSGVITFLLPSTPRPIPSHAEQPVLRVWEALEGAGGGSSVLLLEPQEARLGLEFGVHHGNQAFHTQVGLRRWHPSWLPQLRTLVQPWEPRLLQAQGCDTNPGHRA